MRPMLAEKSSLEDISALLKKTPMFVAPKLDGLRGLVMDGILYSRSMKPIRNKHVQSMFGCTNLDGLDGELIYGSPTAHDVYRQTNSACMSIEGTPMVDFYAFDYFNRPDTSYKARYNALLESRVNSVRVVQQTPVQTLEEVLALEEEYLGQGYEGLILRHPQSPYKQGRSTLKEGWMLKLKRFVDSEARIIGMTELMHNDNAASLNERGYTQRSKCQENLVPAGTMGNLIVQDIYTGWEFEVGTGFSAAERQWFYDRKDAVAGTLIKYSYFPIGMKDKPRHPTYRGIRDPDDLDV